MLFSLPFDGQFREFFICCECTRPCMCVCAFHVCSMCVHVCALHVFLQRIWLGYFRKQASPMRCDMRLGRTAQPLGTNVFPALRSLSVLHS